MLDLDAVDLGEFLLMIRGAHLLGPATIDDGDVFRAQPPGLHGDIDGGVAATDDDDFPADRQMRLVLCLAQPRDIGDCIFNAP